MHFVWQIIIKLPSDITSCCAADLKADSSLNAGGLFCSTDDGRIFAVQLDSHLYVILLLCLSTPAGAQAADDTPPLRPILCLALCFAPAQFHVFFCVPWSGEYMFCCIIGVSVIRAFYGPDDWSSTNPQPGGPGFELGVFLPLDRLA